MANYFRDYSIEWREECEADSFEEAEKILDKQADKEADGLEITYYSEVEQEENENNKNY